VIALNWPLRLPSQETVAVEKTDPTGKSISLSGRQVVEELAIMNRTIAEKRISFSNLQFKVV
jgi:hypothetical protein